MALTRAPNATQIGDESSVGDARRAATALAATAGFTQTDTGKLAVAVTEAASNVLKHGGGGQILLRQTDCGIEMLALDKGPGIAHMGHAMEDWSSTVGTNGIGLGAIARMASAFDIYSSPGQGTALLAQFHTTARVPTPASLLAGAASAPYPGETASGDAWAMAGTAVFMVDGLGHGIHAAAAADAAIEAFTGSAVPSVREAIEAVHAALRSTRGAAVALANIDTTARRVRFCGIGNISGTIVGRDTRGLMSHNGIAGHEPHRIAELEYAWPDRAMLVMHSDGISAKWDLSAYPGLVLRHPSLIAGILFRDFRRLRDDATVVVVKEIASQPLDGGTA